MKVKESPLSDKGEGKEKKASTSIETPDDKKISERLSLVRLIDVDDEQCKHIAAMLSLNAGTVRRLFGERECLVVVKRYVVSPQKKDRKYEKSPVKIPAVRNGVEGHMIIREAHERFVPLHYDGGKHVKVCPHAPGKLCEGDSL